MNSLIITAFIFLLLFAGVALAYVTGAAVTLAYFLTDHARYLAIAPQRIFAQMDVFALMAMPLFIWAGEIMNRAKITDSLVNFSMLLMGRFRGGLGHVNIMTSVFFAGISGSAAADVAALSNTLVPQMEKKGYTRLYAGAITAASSVIGPIIPPSIIMILYGAINSTDVASLFAAGLIPGLIMAAALMLINALLAHYHKHPGGTPDDIPPVAKTIKSALPSLSLPVIILGGIVFGVTTPIEAGGLAILAATLIGYSNRHLNNKDLVDSARKTVKLTGSIFVILAAGTMAAYLIALTQIPDKIAILANGLGFSGYGYLFLLMGVFLILGMGVDLMVALAMVAPLLVPEAIAQGFHPVQVGVLVCLNLTIGLITPPLGGAIIMVSTITKCSYWALVRQLAPFVIVELLVLMAVVLIPELTTYLPGKLGLL